MAYFIKTPWLIKKFYSECVWEIDTKEKNIYLTFDDGPHPQATLYVLEELKKYEAKATFFCIGENIEKYPEIYRQIIDAGHRIGNHTFQHLNGWKTKDQIYLADIEKAAQIIDSNLFRPPYGRITKFQLSAVRGKKLNFTPIMWSVLSGDFDVTISSEECYLNVIKNSKEGSIIVFHDSSKAFTHLQFSLPKVLEYYLLKGFTFKSIPILNNNF